MVPGIAPSADPSKNSNRLHFLSSSLGSTDNDQVLQARMFSYPDAARYRLGTNYQQIPTNAPKSLVYSPFQRDGASLHSQNYGADPNYVGSSLRPIKHLEMNPQHDKWVGDVTSFTSDVTDEDFVQATSLWNVLGRTPGQQDNFVRNLSSHLKGAKPDIQVEAISEEESVIDQNFRSANLEIGTFARVSDDLAQRLTQAVILTS